MMTLNILERIKFRRERNRERDLKKKTCKWNMSGCQFIDLSHPFNLSSTPIDCLECNMWNEENSPFIVKCHTCEYEGIVHFKPVNRFSIFTRVDLGYMKMCTKVGTQEWKNSYWLDDICPLRKQNDEDPYPSWYGIIKEEFDMYKNKWMKEK